jgi:hypothetical protein
MVACTNHLLKSHKAEDVSLLVVGIEDVLTF